MADRKGNKGDDLEELLRAYFLRAGFFVVRNVPFTLEGEDLTDVDLWLYEKPSGSTRRVQIVDIKAKSKPKAVERLFWTGGLVKALRVDGAYVATTDKRPMLRKIAESLDLSIIDGGDLQRLKKVDSIRNRLRMTDAELINELVGVDKSRYNRDLQNARIDVLRTLSDGFGVVSLTRSLQSFGSLAKTCVQAQPESSSAVATGRLAYLAAAIACQSLDYVSIGLPFRSSDERRELLLNAVRFGALGRDSGRQQIRLSVELVRKYAPSGAAGLVERGIKQDLEAIPAEIVADQASKMLKDGQLFTVACELEGAAYSKTCPTFDQLKPGAKSILGAFLDYASVRRDTFALAWSKSPHMSPGSTERSRSTTDQHKLFSERPDAEKGTEA